MGQKILLNLGQVRRQPDCWNGTVGSNGTSVGRSSWHLAVNTAKYSESFGLGLTLEPYAGAAVCIARDEDHAAFLEGLLEPRQRIHSHISANFETGDCVSRDAGRVCEFSGTPSQGSPGHSNLNTLKHLSASFKLT